MAGIPASLTVEQLRVVDEVLVTEGHIPAEFDICLAQARSACVKALVNKRSLKTVFSISDAGYRFIGRKEGWYVQLPKSSRRLRLF